MTTSELHAVLDARSRADLKDARFKLLLSIPAVVLGVGFANVLGLIFWVALYFLGVRMGGWTFLLIFNIVLAVFVAVDLKRHPGEAWFAPRYLQSDGSLKGHEIGAGTGDPVLIYMIERTKGMMSGMPLMTRVTDPINMAERGRAISNGFANLILSGPRSMVAALGERKRVAHRSRRQNVSSAEAFVAWLSPRGPLPEADVKEHLEAHPQQVAGFALARQIGVVARFRNPVDFHYRVR